MLMDRELERYGRWRGRGQQELRVEIELQRSSVMDDALRVRQVRHQHGLD